MRTPADSICAYLCAKDGNRPYLMAHAFTEGAFLTMHVNTGAISFPPLSRGRDNISDVLVKQFSQTYENVYTLCMADPPVELDIAFVCDWLVVMTERQTGAVRVGCGRYDWCFVPQSHLAERLTITIESMQVLSPNHMEEVMRWVATLPYPWCTREQVMNGIPDLSELGPVVDYIVKRECSDSLMLQKITATYRSS